MTVAASRRTTAAFLLAGAALATTTLPVTVAFRAFSATTSRRASAPRTTTTAPAPRSTAAAAGSAAATALRATSTAGCHPIFDFSSSSDPDVRAKSLASFERIDDAIMGGISTSALRDDGGDGGGASWSGVCRTDGGGFCGVRTRPLVRPLDVPDGTEGMYLDCDLVSDDDARRRVWKMSLRTDARRGETVYQAAFDLGKAIEDECVLREALDEAREAEVALRNAIRVAREYGARREADDADEGAGDGLRRAMDDAADANGRSATADDADDGDRCWTRVLVPFDDFRLVRGPRLVPDAPKLDPAGGIYQIGMTMSKFRMAQNLTELEDFRPGYFDLRIRSLGFYGAVGEEDEAAVGGASSEEEDGPAAAASAAAVVAVPDTLTKEEAARKRPFLLKVLSPVARLFFSEQANRRRSAMRLLREERHLSRAGAILFGVRCRRRSMGLVPSVLTALGIVAVDAFRAAFFVVLKVLLVYPLRAVRRAKRALGTNVKPSLAE